MDLAVEYGYVLSGQARFVDGPALEGDVIATAVYALHNQMTVQDMGELWCPYPTMTEALKLAAQNFTRDVSELSCCAA